jgi:D-alanine-D-alanine ligase
MKIVVAYGGISNERNISIESGLCVYNALVELNKDVYLLDVKHKNISGELDRLGADVCFNALHGAFGEDGLFQSICESIDLPYTGSSPIASAIAMDKVQAKRIFQAEGLPTLPFFHWTADNNDPVPEFDFPWCIKPNLEGSSVGLVRVSDVNHWRDIKASLQPNMGESLLIEPLATGEEVTVGIINGHALPPIFVRTKHGLYDYNAKYERNDTEYLFNIGMSEIDLEKIKCIALRAYNTLGCHGWGRVDIIFQNDKPYILEINTIPGLTSHSLVPKAFEHQGGTFNQLILEILKTSKLHSPKIVPFKAKINTV